MRAARLVDRFSRALGASRGIVGGQAWELEASAPLGAYHGGKTAALFEAATAGGAIAATGEDAGFAAVGRAIGHAVREHGVTGAERILRARVDEAIAAVPARPGEPVLRAWLARCLEPLIASARAA